MSKFLNNAGKLLLTLFVAVFFLFLLGGMLRIQAAFHASQTELSNVALHVGVPSPAAGRNSAIQNYWPEFPHTGGRNTQGVVINGVATLTEDWETEASAAEVLSYYRDQMTARGWKDTTEETYGLQPEALDMGAIESGPRGQEFATDYARIMDSTLVFSRQGRTVQISAQPAQKNAGGTLVKIFAAETSSIRDFFNGMETAFVPNAGQARRPMDAVQHDAGATYHTTIVTSDEPPARAFEEKLATLVSQRWQRATIPSKPGTRPGFSAWLMRGSQYAILSASPSSQGGGSSVTFMEVTPEGRK
jgi:hypothetical protein